MHNRASNVPGYNQQDGKDLSYSLRIIASSIRPADSNTKGNDIGTTNDRGMSFVYIACMISYILSHYENTILCYLHTTNTSMYTRMNSVGHTLIKHCAYTLTR